MDGDAKYLSHDESASGASPLGEESCVEEHHRQLHAIVKVVSIEGGIKLSVHNYVAIFSLEINRCESISRYDALWANVVI